MKLKGGALSWAKKVATENMRASEAGSLQPFFCLIIYLCHARATRHKRVTTGLTRHSGDGMYVYCFQAASNNAFRCACAWRSIHILPRGRLLLHAALSHCSAETFRNIHAAIIRTCCYKYCSITHLTMCSAYANHNSWIPTTERGNYK